MLRKKGFTLVELLGVIVILSILALITIPIISNVVTNVRINALKNSAYGLIEASNLYYAQYGTDNNLRFNITGNKVESSDTDKLLTYRGSVKEGTVILDKKGSVTVCVTDGKNSAYKNYNESKVTTKKGKCEIYEGSSIVYLDGEATITDLSTAELTERLIQLEEKMDNIYSIGSIYMSMTDDTVAKVEAKFGGTWEQIESGYMLQSTTTTSNQKGGDTTASFTPSGTVGDTTLEEDQMPRHNHTVQSRGNTFVLDASQSCTTQTLYVVSFTAKSMCNGTSVVTNYKGNSLPHTHTFTGNQETINIVPPYITVYMYKRTA